MVSLQDSATSQQPPAYRPSPIPRVSVQSLPSTSAHGVPTRRLTRTIQGTPTDVCIQEYLDRTFVLVTQVGKLGVVTQASLPADTPLNVGNGSTAINGGASFTDDWDHDDDDDAAAANPSPAAHLSITPNLVQTPLLGIAPQDQADLYSLYVSCIYGALRSASNSGVSDDGGYESEPRRDERPVIVSLGLKMSPAPDLSSTSEDFAESNRETFLEVVQAVKDCMTA